MQLQFFLIMFIFTKKNNKWPGNFLYANIKRKQHATITHLHANKSAMDYFISTLHTLNALADTVFISDTQTMCTRCRFFLAFYVVLRPQGIRKQMKTLRKRQRVHIASMHVKGTSVTYFFREKNTFLSEVKNHVHIVKLHIQTFSITILRMKR